MEMSTDDEKKKLENLLKGLEVPDVKLTSRCSTLIDEFHQKYDKELEEETIDVMEDLASENPYKPPRELLEENERKLKELLSSKIKPSTNGDVPATPTAPDPKKPWRTNSNKERLLRINNELRHHEEKASQAIGPMEPDAMRQLVAACGAGAERPGAEARVSADRLRDVVESAKRNLPNFQYRQIYNTTATKILVSAHELGKQETLQQNAVVPLEDSTDQC